MPIAISIQSVTKSFKDVMAINDLSLEIRQGEYVALLGPNGAGKTTLVEMIEGIRKPDSGKISILGKNWKDDELVLKSKLGFSLQETKFVDKLTVKETLELFASFYNSDKNLTDLLDLTGLIEKKDSYVENLSGGQRQKLALAIALIHDPEILIMDEPTTGLDPSARKDIWNLVQSLRKKSTTLILTTHYMEEAEFLCERIIVLDKGKILLEGQLDELLKKRKHEEFIEFILKKPSKNLKKISIRGLQSFHWDPLTGAGLLTVNNIVESLPLFLNYIKKSGYELEKLECRKATLNDLFLSLTGRSLNE